VVGKNRSLPRRPASPSPQIQVSTGRRGRGAANRGGKLAQVLGRGKLIVGTDSATPPFCFKDEAGNWTGFDIDFAKELATGLFDKTRCHRVCRRKAVLADP